MTPQPNQIWRSAMVRNQQLGFVLARMTPQPNQIWRNVGSQEDAAVLASTEHLVQFAMRGYVFSVPPKFFAKCFYHPMQNQQQSTAMDDLKDMKPPQFSDAAPKPSTASGRQQIIDKMTAAVMSDRNKSYGDPEGNFGNIAALWNAYLNAQGVDVTLKPTDVAAMSALIKVARLSTNPTHVDSWVDLAGYAACGGGIVVSKEEKK